MTEEIKAETNTPAPQETSTPAPEVQPATVKEGQTQDTTQTNKVNIPEPQATGLPKGVRTEIYKLRAERREMREKLEKLEKQVNEKANAVNKPAEEPTNFYDDPAKALADTEQRAARAAIAEMQKMATEKARVEALEKEGQQTIDLLLKKPEINGNMDIISEIDEIILNDPRLAQIVLISPQAAGKEAYEIWAKEKGIDEGSKASGASARAATSAPSSSSMTTKASMTISDIQKAAAQLDPSDPKFNEKWNSLMAESLKATS